jgi:predicted kinase
MFVLIGGWPGSGKSTLAASLATELALPLLAKDEIKEALANSLGQPMSVAESQRLGRAAVTVMLRVAHRCPGAVMDSTWYEYTRPLVAALTGPIVEIRCILPRELARSRYLARATTRHPGHLDLARDEGELWGTPPTPLGVGIAIDVDTTIPTDVRAIAQQVVRAATKLNPP